MSCCFSSSVTFNNTCNQSGFRKRGCEGQRKNALHTARSWRNAHGWTHLSARVAIWASVWRDTNKSLERDVIPWGYPQRGSFLLCPRKVRVGFANSRGWQPAFQSFGDRYLPGLHLDISCLNGAKPARAWNSQNTEYVTRINKTRRHFYWGRQDPYWGFMINKSFQNELSISTRCG